MNDEKIAALNTTFGITIYSLTLNDWVAIATLTYLLLQMGLLMPKYWRLFRDWRSGRK
jgi:hypothetical protein